MPNKTLVQLLKKVVGAIRYNSTINHIVNKGYRSKKKLKNNISATNIIDPGKPKKISRFTKLNKNNLGHKKFTPFISVISLVLKRRPIASTSKNEFVDKRA